MDDLTPHLGNIIGDIADRLTLAGIGISCLTINTGSTPNLPPRITLFTEGHYRPSIAEARRTVETLADDTAVTVSAPYGTAPQVNVEVTVTLDGQLVQVTVIADPDPATPAEQGAEQDGDR